MAISASRWRMVVDILETECNNSKFIFVEFNRNAPLDAKEHERLKCVRLNMLSVYTTVLIDSIARPFSPYL